MRKLAILAAATLAATSLSSTAFAQYVFNSNGDTSTISFVGLGDPDLSGDLTLTLVSTSGLDYNFTWSLENTSGSGNPLASISGFGFDVVGGTLDFGTSSVSTDDPGDLIDDNLEINTISSGSISNGVGNSVDFCATAGPNCAGGGSGGPETGDTWTGELVIEFTGTLPDEITLNDPRIRFQSTGLNGEGSDIGVPTAVPEPATWAMMLVGFGATGYAMRRGRRRKVLLEQIA